MEPINKIRFFTSISIVVMASFFELKKDSDSLKEKQRIEKLEVKHINVIPTKDFVQKEE